MKKKIRRSNKTETREVASVDAIANTAARPMPMASPTEYPMKVVEVIPRRLLREESKRFYSDGTIMEVVETYNPTA